MLNNINTFWKENSGRVGSALLAVAVVTAMYSIPYIAYFTKYGL